MKRFIPVLVYFPFLLLLCHQLFFIVLNFASLSMTSDADINKAAVKFFFALPIIVASGLWAAHQMFRPLESRFRYRRSIVTIFITHGGLYGAISTNALMRAFQFDFENQTRWAYIIILAFIATSLIALVGFRSIAGKPSINPTQKSSQ